MRKAIAAVQRSAENLDAMVADARPGVQNFSKNTLPEVNRLVRDLRDLSTRCRASRSGSMKMASAARSVRRNCPTTSRGRNNEPNVAFAAPVALALRLSACGGLLGGGAKAPPWLLTLTPQAPAPEALLARPGRARR